MTKLKIHLLLPFKRSGKVATKKLSCRGIVVRSESVSSQDYFNVAIFFNEISPTDARTISDYIHQQLEEKNPSARSR